MNAYEAKIQDRQERLTARAAKLRETGERLLEGSRMATAGIPYGQPILVGHHSEKRHRRDQARSWSMMERGVKALEKAEYLDRKADRPGTAISTDDPKALEKLREKLERIEAEHRVFKLANAAYRKARRRGATQRAAYSVAGCDIDDREFCFIAGEEYESTPPYPAYALANSRNRIRSVKERIHYVETLHFAVGAPESGAPEVEIAAGEEWRCYSDPDANRVCVEHTKKPPKEVRSELIRYGFLWSRRNGRWQRMASPAGLSAARFISDWLRDRECV